MCIKTCRVSSLVSQTKTSSLNPSAQEWRPSSHNQTPPLLQHHVLFTPPHYHPTAAPLPPPPPAVQFVTVTSAPPPQKVTAFELHQLSYCQGFNPFVIPLSQPEIAYHHTALASFPASVYFHEVAPPFPELVNDGEIEMMVNPERRYSETPPSRKMDSPTAKSPKCHPLSNGRKRFSPNPRRAMRSFSLDTKPTTLRQEWRPRRAYSDNGVPAGGAAVQSPEFSPSSATTVMIKNIPNKLRRDYMLEFLDLYCYEYSLEYDFLYLPMDFRTKDNLGYAFVNFTSAGDAEKFKKLLQNYEWGTVNTGRDLFDSNKICEITWARIQGKQGQLDRYRNSRFECDKLDFLPVVLDPPRNGSDPKPAPPVVLGKLQKRALSKIYY